MNTKNRFLYATSFLLAFSGRLCGQSFGACPDGIAVSGQASMKILPDEATLVLSVESTNEDVDVALQKNSDSLSQLENYLKKDGATR